MSVAKPKFLSLENFEGNSTKLSPKLGQCIIHVQRHDSLWWSLILALLFPVRKRQKFTSLFMKLFEFCGQQDIIKLKHEEDLFDFFKTYNPFLDRQSCFNNTVLENLVAVFKQKAECDLRKKHCVDLNSRLSEIADQLLHYNIVLCDMYQSDIKVFYFSQDKKLSGKVLTLYYEREVGDSSSEFSVHFGIKEDDGRKFQKNALTRILRIASFSEQWINKVNSFLSSDNNVPLSLVQNEMYEGIQLLYKQPHVLSKLEEAGYIVDPFMLNANGENALSLSIDKKNARAAVYKFYTYISSTGRNADPFLHGKLEIAKNVLEENKDTFMRYNRGEIVAFIEQLIKFNNFRSAVATKFHKINEQSSTIIRRDDLREVSRSKEKIIAVLSTYLEYFNFKDYVPAPQSEHVLNMLTQFITEIIPFEKHIPYFEMLDMHAALILFDNLFFLKQKVKHNPSDLRAYEGIESKFLSFLFTCEIYGFSELLYPSTYEGTVRNLEPVIHRLYLPNVIFERRKLRNDLKQFQVHIASRPIQLAMKTQVFSTLTSVPIIHDVIILRTVIRYLDNVLHVESSATEENNTNSHEVNKLVTERLLQVLGENLKECSVDSVTLGKSLLMSSFPPETRNDICTIRDTLVHVTEGTNAENRLRVEKNTEIFNGIRDELKNFRLQCGEFLQIMELLMKVDVLRRNHSYRKGTLQHSYEVTEKDSSVTDHLVATINADGNLETLASIRHQIENHICTEDIEKPRTIQCINVQLKAKNFFDDRCKGHLEVHFDFVKHYMIKAQSVPSMREKCLDSILFYVHCIEVLLLQCAYIFAENSSELLSSFEEELTSALTAVQKIAKLYTQQGDLDETDFLELKIKKESLMKLYDSICGKSSTNRKCLNKEKFCHIEKFSKSLRVYRPLSDTEKTVIISSVPQRFKDHSEAKSNLMSMSQQTSNGQKVVQNKAVRLQIQKLLPPQRKNIRDWFCNKGSLPNLSVLNGIKDPFVTLKGNLDNDELIRKRDYHDYCSKFGWSGEEEATRLLEKFVNGDPFKTKKDVIRNQRSATHFEFLKNRIVALRTLLITSDERIGEMWFEAKDPNEKMQVKFLIVQKFLSDKKFQAAVEMLFFDCMSVQKNAAHLENLWIKASHLFSGINLRNVLAHQNPLIEELGKMLDPDDLATEIVSKCLDIVEKENLENVSARQNPFIQVQGVHNDLEAEIASNCLDTVGKEKLKYKPTNSLHGSQLSSENRFSLFVAQAFTNNVLSFTFFIIVLLLLPVSTN